MIAAMQAELRSLIADRDTLVQAHRATEVRLDELDVTGGEDALSGAEEALAEVRGRRRLDEASAEDVAAAKDALSGAEEALADCKAAAEELRGRMRTLDSDIAVIKRRISLLYMRCGRVMRTHQAARVQAAALALGVEFRLFAQLMSCASGVNGGETSGRCIFDAAGLGHTFQQAQLSGQVLPVRFRQLTPAELAALDLSELDRLHVVDASVDDPPPAPPPAAA